jgi:hypothetical protein
VSALADGGGFVVAGKDDAGIWAQIFDFMGRPAACAQTGGPRPCQIAVAGAASRELDLAADPESSGFVVVWEETLSGEDRADFCDHPESPPSGLTLLGRLYDGQGRAGCTKRLAAAVDGTLAGDSAPPHVGWGDRLVVIWQQGGASSDVFTRAFDRDWNALAPSGEVDGGPRANLFAGGLQRRPAVAVHGDDVALAWESGPPAVDLPARL